MGLTDDRTEAMSVIAEGLMMLVDKQAKGAANLPPHLLRLDQQDFITASLGMFVELGELVNEARWKPWRMYDNQPTPAERQKLLKELGDVLHFLPWMIRNLQARFGITAVDVADAFLEAHEENIRRFRGEVPGREPPSAQGTTHRRDECASPSRHPEGCQSRAQASGGMLEYCGKCGGSWSCTPSGCTAAGFGPLRRS